MFIVYGKRTIRVKKFVDQRNFCKECGSPNLLVKLYREYFHFFFIPVLPTHEKSSRMACTACGEPFRNESIQREYENNSRAPFYLYTWPLLIGAIIVVAVTGNIITQKEKQAFVANPKEGDVYLVRENANNFSQYYFLRLTRIKGDTVTVYRNSITYLGYVSEFNEDDYFVREDSMLVTKSDLKKMLDSDAINAVERDYDDNTGFNRIKTSR